MFIEYFHNLLQKNPLHPLGVAKLKLFEIKFIWKKAKKLTWDHEDQY